jgi:hypothetical protein
MAKRAPKETDATPRLETPSQLRDLQRERVKGPLRQVGMTRGWKLCASGMIALHLLAVLIGPFSFFTRSSRGISPSAAPIRAVLSPYIEFAYLNHGYFFFAPNPGPSHLLECKLTAQDGEASRLRLPDRSVQWPRLLYHRHFMLAEFLHAHHVPPLPETQGELPPGQSEWAAERMRFVSIRDSMIKHLKIRYQVSAAEILRLEHRLPSDIEVFRERIPLSDERLYTVLPDAPLDAMPIVPPSVTPSRSLAKPVKEVLAPEVIQQVQP